METPTWLALWQAADSVLAIATSCALALPVMILLCLALGRRRQREAMARAENLFLIIAFVTAAFAVLSLAGHGLVPLKILPASMGLETAEFDPLAGPWLATTTGFLSWAAGFTALLFCWITARPVYQASFAELDSGMDAAMNTRAMIAAGFAFAAFICFGGSIVLRNWPFLGLPEQMSQQDAIQVLVKYVWKMTCAAFMPAGALAVLTFFLRLEPVSAELRKKDRELRRSEVIPGTAEELFPLTEAEKTVVRMGAAFALAGAAFQFLDSSYLAFTQGAAFGNGLHGAFMRFGPFTVTVVSLVCWAFIFARPRRHQVFLALLPVLLIFLRAAGGF